MRSRGITRKTKALTDRILAAVHELEPTAQVILHGSRARGDAEPDSDWDLLILVDGPVGHERQEAIMHRLYELELETDTVFGVIVHSKEEWDSPIYRAMPFHQNVTGEGIRL